MRARRFALSTLASAAVAAGVLAALPAPAHAADTDVKINEVSTSGGIPSDWVELTNTGAAAVDIGGWVVKDSGEGSNTSIPAGVSIAPGGFYTVDMSGLGGNDQARLFNGATQIDGVSWVTAPATTWSRCPDGSGALTDTEVGTKGLPNACAAAQPWPGGASVTTVDPSGVFGGNLSGLAYEGSGSTAPGTMWAVKNDPGTLYKVTDSAGTWAPASSWDLNYTTGTGNPDSEGVTITDAGAAGGVYVATERNGDNNSVSRPAILRYVPSGSGGALTATNDWNLSTDLPGLEANSGLEAVAWVPDSYLTSRGLKTDGGATYAPAQFPNHGDGLFFVGVEQTGQVIGYALNHTDNTFTRVATISRFMSTVTDLVYDPASDKVWAECDNNCGGRVTVLDIATSGPDQGHFVPGTTYDRPTGAVSNFNNEGFTIASRTECVGGSRPVFWADDGNDGGNALRAGTISCTPASGPTITGSATSSRPKSASGWYSAPVTVSFACTSGSSPLSGGCPTPVTLSSSGAGQSVSRTVHNYDFATATATVGNLDIDLAGPAVKIKGVKKGKTYPKVQKAKCKASDGLSGLDGKCKVKSKKKGSKVTVTATATDKAGNVTTAKLTYTVRKPKK